MVTKKRDLRTGMPLWLKYKHAEIPFNKLEKDQKADIAVIGAGISGAMVAEELSTRGYSVIVLDSRAPLKGSTPASTALLQYEIDEPLSSLMKKIGEKDAIRAWQRSKQGVDNLAAKIQKLEIGCDAVRRPALYLAGNKLNAKKLKDEFAARNFAGLYTDYLTKKELQNKYGINRTAALKSFDNLSADPYKLATGLLLECKRNGGKIFAPAKCVKIEEKPRSVKLHTNNGTIITARYAIFTTGYEVPKYIPHNKYKIISTWAIATKPQQKLWTEECFIWEASDPYLYIRTSADGRIICGGEDAEFSNEEKRDALIPQKTKILEKKLKKLLPHVDSRAEFAWTGCFGVSPNNLPKIGKLPGKKNCFALMGLGGNGITFSRVGTEILAAEIEGRKDPDAHIFKI